MKILKKSADNGKIDIDLSEYPSGIYFIELQTGTQNDIIKLMKK